MSSMLLLLVMVLLANATVAVVIVVVLVVDVMESVSVSSPFVVAGYDIVTIAVVDAVVATAVCAE